MIKISIIRRLPSGKYRLYSRKKDKDGKRRNLGTYDSLEAAKNREKEVQFFKHHADDGAEEDKETKVLSKLSEIAEYLEEAGFVDRADKVYEVMGAIDGSLDDNVVDSDYQMARPGSSDYTFTGEDFRGTFDAGVAQRMAQIANEFDKMGLFIYANEIDNILVSRVLAGSDKMDNILKIITKLDDILKNRKFNVVEVDEDNMEGSEAISRSNGRMINDITDSQNTGMFGDMYFCNTYQNQEGAYGPTYG